jgi:hypothetical protein
VAGALKGIGAGAILRDLKAGALQGIVAGIVMALALCATASWYCLSVPGTPHSGPLPPISAEETEVVVRLKQHVTAIASTPHNVQHFENLEAAARYIEQSLTTSGYAVAVQAYEVDGEMVRNLEATIEPKTVEPDASSIIIGAHYDSAGDAPGANDNGSGTAAVLELARLLKDARPARTRLRFVLFVNEEPPYFQTEDMGSYRYARLLAERHEPVSAMISLETIGFFSDRPGSQRYPQPFGAVFRDKGDFIAFVGMPGSRSLVHKVMASFRSHTAFPSIGGVAPGNISGIAWSDHWSFAQHGFPAMMVTDTAVFRYPHYHRPTDTPDKVDYERLARITKGMDRVIRELAK